MKTLSQYICVNIFVSSALRWVFSVQWIDNNWLYMGTFGEKWLIDLFWKSQSVRDMFLWVSSREQGVSGMFLGVGSSEQ